MHIAQIMMTLLFECVYIPYSKYN